MALAAMTPLVRADEPAPVPDVKIGMYQTMFRDVTPTMIKAVALPLKSTLEKAVGITGDAELLPDANALAAKLSDKKVQIGVFLGYEFAWVKQNHPNLEPLVLAVPPGGKLKTVVVVNVANPATCLADLKEQSVLIPKATKAHCLIYLDDQRKGFEATTAKRVEKPRMTTEEVLEQVAIGNEAAAVVDASNFASYSKYAPGNANALKVIATSGTFPFAVLAVHKDGISAEIRKKVYDGLLGAHNSSVGKPLMMLWGLKAFEEVPADYNDELAAILKQYPAPKLVAAITVSEKK